jgi:CRISPR-associated endonuclease/helicase Cas3
MLLAKSEDHAITKQPITLDDHTRHVDEEGAYLLDARPFVCEKYVRLTGKNLRQSLHLCACWHDAGKAEDDWQGRCQEDYKLWKQGKPTFHLRKGGIRHEMASLLRLQKSGVTYGRAELVSIAAHHNKLSRRAEKRWSDNLHGQKAFLPLWEALQIWNNEFRLNDPASFAAAIRKRYLYDGPRALLQLADHRASAKEGGDDVPPLLPFDYEFKFSNNPRPVQKIIEELWDEPLAILRAPTGAGKTDAALLWAKHQIDSGRADRLVIAMPTRFTANALSISTANSLSQTGLYHSSAWFKAQKENNPEKDKTRKAIIRKETELARQLETPVTVTTLDHLCICLTGAREDHHAIFWGLAHSCVVIDEADFYDEFTQYNLVTLLTALRVLDVRVLIMSATVPPPALELYAKSGCKVSKIYGDESNNKDLHKEIKAALKRPRCKVHLGHSMTSPDDIADLLQAALAGTPTIIYANTVKRAQEYCDWFIENEFDDYVLYHSRFTEPDKARKEEQLVEMLGAKAWDKDGEPHGVAILTQIGELSVNISADLMISDLCPVDRLAQRAGRLSRFGKQIGDLYVVTPLKASKDGGPEFYPAPYGEYITNHGWKAAPALLKSQEWLKQNTYSAQSWIEGVNSIYPELEKPQHETIKNQDMLEKSLITNWLIVQAAEANDNDEGTAVWRSRNIPPQQTVYVEVENDAFISGESEPPFRSWGRFREWEQQHAIQVLSYECKEAIQIGTLEKRKTSIGDDEEEILVARKQCYTLERGLRLTSQEDESEENHDEF